MAARILIVEDNATNLMLMAYVLEAFGHEVTQARSGHAALEATRNEPYDLILADILMPSMDGYEFVRLVKGNEGTAATTVVAVTALAMVGDRERILGSGFDGYITKPINPETFVHEVDAYLKPGLRSARKIEGTPDEAPATPASPSGRMVLVVDDEATNALVVRAALEPMGHRVVDVRTVREAIALSDVTPPDLVISDVQMPDAGGFDLIKTFRAEPRLASIPFIFLSSSFWHDDYRARGIALGASKFLVRPIDPGVLIAEIQDVLGRLAGG